MRKTQTDTPLSSTEKALMAYLDDMLRESTDAAPVVPVEIRAAAEPVPGASVRIGDPQPLAPVNIPSAPAAAATPASPAVATPAPRVAPVVAAPAVTASPVAAVSAPPVVATPTVARVSVPTRVELPEEAPVQEEAGDAIPTLPKLPDWVDRGRPDWASAPFEALIFKVGGLKMAVPLISLGLIHPIEKRFHELPRQNPWFIGMLRTPNATIKVIDTALCVMPERYDAGMRDTLKFVITLHGYEWGLAAHEVDKAILLDPTRIQWRTRRGKRPWLAGTVVDHMCALIDGDGFHHVIQAAEREHPTILAPVRP